jgi:hypothetical protein
VSGTGVVNVADTPDSYRDGAKVIRRMPFAPTIVS